MATHQAERVNVPVGLLARLGQGLDEVVSVNVQEDVLALVSAARYAIHRAGILDSNFTSHDASRIIRAKRVKNESGDKPGTFFSKD